MNALDALRIRINTMDLKQPYVWRLRISAAEFAALENAVKAGTTTPLQNVVYLAEWYKRRYDGGTAKPVKEFDCRALFENSGISQANNLFQSESGIKMWQYSIFVLGGVAILFESREANTRFLKELCRIYYGEDGDVEKLGDKDNARAVAFRESVRTRGSIYQYLTELLSDNPPFAEDDLSDETSPENAFIKQIKNANNEILKSKFDLEWIFGFEPNAEYMTRKLRLVLKPESSGGLNHQYLKYERARHWGINSEKCRRIAIGVRFLRDGESVAEANFDRPIIEYSATGSREAGFVAWGTERFSRKIEVPNEKFNAVEIVARDDKGADHDIESFKVDDWMQVFRIPDRYNEWTSRHFAQRDSAIICPEDFEMLNVEPTETIYKKRFWRKDGGGSDVYQWRAVYDMVRFKDGGGREIALVNRQGYDQIVTRLHHDILRYHGGCVSYVVDQDEEREESLLPLAFNKKDLIVRHFETRNDMTDNAVSETDYEKIEFLDDVCYREWTEEDMPKQGKAILRITIKGVPRKFVVYYLPVEIQRDCGKEEIRCDDEIYKDELPRDGIPTDPIVCKKFGTDAQFVELEIWRPSKHKEIIRGGKVVKYVEAEETADISYALKDDLVIHDFSEEGYREYRCRELGNIYALPNFSPNKDQHLNAYVEGLSVEAYLLDARAPRWLRLNLAAKFEKTANERLLYWDYLPEHKPSEVENDSICEEDHLVFHDLKNYGGLCVLSCQIPEPNPFSETPLRANLAGCFEVTAEHGNYYFIMQCFREANLDLKQNLYEPLMSKRGQMLTDEDRRGLRRLAEELGFDWQKKYNILI